MKQFRKMTIPYIVWISIMIVVPTLLIALYAFSRRGNSVTTIWFTLDNFKNFVTDTIFLQVLARSLWVAFITTIICILIGYPAAYFIAKASDGMKVRWVLIITFPTWINMLVRTYAWVGILQDDGIINRFLGLFGIGPVKMMYTGFAVILGMVYNFLPFMILQIYTALTKMDQSLVEASHDLGAGKRDTFIHVILPLSLPGVISGITLVFLPAVSSFFIPEFLGGGQFLLIGNLIDTQFSTAGNWNFGSAISLIMTLLIMLMMYITGKIDKTEQMEKGATE